MQLFAEEEVPKLSFTKSANVIKLDLNEKMSKKSQIKLLNAKIRNLKNKCKALREESKTDRQILSNLMNTTSQLESKTNLGIQACKQVSTQLFENHAQSMSFSLNSNLNQTAYSIGQITLQSNRIDQKQVKEECKSIEKLLGSLQLQFQRTDESKNAIYNIPTQRSITASLKSQERDLKDAPLNVYLISANLIRQNDSKSPDKLRRANTISFNESKVSKIQRRSSLQQSFTPKKSKKLTRSESYNVFKSYIYTVILTVTLTIIFFKLLF